MPSFLHPMRPRDISMCRRLTAAEKVAVTLIPVSVYGPWYIVQEKGMAEGIDPEVRIIEGITARNAGLSTGHLQCMITTMDSTVVARAAAIPVKHIAVPPGENHRRPVGDFTDEEPMKRPGS